MKKRTWLVYIAAVLAGTALHFIYEWWPNPLIGLIAPVNESVWEHMKLLFWPFFGAAVWDYCHDRRLCVWGAYMAAQLLMPAALLGCYYLLETGFGLSGLVIDLALYYLTMAGGFWFAGQHRNSAKFGSAAGVLTMAAAVYGSCLLVFTIAAPNFPIFREK